MEEIKEINDHYTNVKSQELTKAKGEIERLKKGIEVIKDCANKNCNNFDAYNDFVYLTCDELLKEVK